MSTNISIDTKGKFKIIEPIFDIVYSLPCKKDKSISVGSVLCVGHNELRLKKCTHCLGFTENKTKYYSIIKENVKIVDQVFCSYQPAQLEIEF
jgi:hypothetical protein